MAHMSSEEMPGSSGFYLFIAAVCRARDEPLNCRRILLSLVRCAVHCPSSLAPRLDDVRNDEHAAPAPQGVSQALLCYGDDDVHHHAALRPASLTSNNGRPSPRPTRPRPTRPRKIHPQLAHLLHRPLRVLRPHCYPRVRRREHPQRPPLPPAPPPPRLRPRLSPPRAAHVEVPRRHVFHVHAQAHHRPLPAPHHPPRPARRV